MQIQSLEILVVEESDAFRAVTVGQLRALGARSIEAVSSGAEALKRMQERRFHVVLSGWNGKLMDGLALLKAVRADDRLRNVAMVMVTAEAEPEQIEEAIASGVSELLVKPYTRAVLESKLVSSVEWRERAPAVLSRAPSPPAAQPAAPTQSLLVVDDTPENLQVISQIFADRYEVRAVRSGERALQICTSDTPPDLVLLDVMMPGMDGFEVARRMREHPNSEHIPVIFVTALNEQVHERRGLGLGAVDFVTKPIDPELLRLRVRNFMRLVARQKQRQAECDAQLAAARTREGVEELLRHDLRNPIASVMGAASLLAQDAALSAPSSRIVRLISVAAAQALDTVNMSSAMFKIQTGAFVLQPENVDIGALIAEAIELAAIWREAKGLSFSVNLPPARARGDAALCRSIFNNLLRNACEAAPSGSTVVIEGTAGAEISIAMVNQGVVPKAARERFFERYVTSGKRGGTGLGTYSARLLTQAQGGQIEMVTNDATNTTRLVVTLPAAATA